MDRKDIIKEIGKYFDIVELVCPHTHRKWGEKSWQFLDTEFLHNLLVVRRDILKSPMYCNNWDKGGSFRQRGLRCNLCQIPINKTNTGVLYLSAHVMGKAGDFDVDGMTAEEARMKILANKDKMPYPFRLEGNVNWLHIDSFDTGSNAGFVVF